MTSNRGKQTAPFLLVGIDHHQASVAVRERFSLSQPEQLQLLQALHAAGVHSPLIIATCNRTQIFCRNTQPELVIRQLLQHSGGTMEDFRQYGQVLHCQPALQKLFEIAAGLDSQVLGDLQIIKQVKDAYQTSVEAGLADAHLHRLMQHVLRAHKRIRNETDLGKGAASIAGAAVRYVVEQVGSLREMNVLLVGSGKIGKVACANLVGFSPRKITVVNRTFARAEKLGLRFEVNVAPWEALTAEIAAADVVLVATGAQEPVVLPHHVQCPAIGRKVLVDLSIPRNIAPEVGNLPNIEVADLDNLRSESDAAFAERQASVGPALDIIAHELEKYEAWRGVQKVAPTIRALTEKFESIRRNEMEFFRNKLEDGDLDKVEQLTERIVKKIAAHSIEHLRANANEAEDVTAFVRDMFKLEN